MSKLRHRESWYSRTKKELEEMDYKEKYEKALNEAKEIYDGPLGDLVRDILECIFPELEGRNRKTALEKEIETWIPGHISGGEGEWKYCKQAIINWGEIVARHFYEFAKAEEQNKELELSEDERVRKKLVSYFNEFTRSTSFEEHEVLEIRRWLKKQKEPKDYRELYKGVSQSEWFKKAYAGKSLGEEEKQK